MNPLSKIGRGMLSRMAGRAYARMRLLRRDGNAPICPNQLLKRQIALQLATAPKVPRIPKAVKEPDPISSKFTEPELGANKAAFSHLQINYERNILPLVQSLQDDTRNQSLFDRFLRQEGSSYKMQLRAFSQQRALSETEEKYLKSVEKLSSFNPTLVACARINPELTSRYLQQHFTTQSQTTLSKLKDGDYVPLVQIGLGPQGLIALGEVTRQNPELSNSMLVVDAGKQPGGPFAIPEGAAWKLNSANPRGKEHYPLPLKPNLTLEPKTVRAYGSPLCFYPGERGKSNVREGSINRLVDYLPDVGDISDAQYATNADLQLIASLQAAMLTNKLALCTKVIKIRKNQDLKASGNKIVTLETTNNNGTKSRINIQTNAVFVLTGLGKPKYGFDLKTTSREAKRAQEVIQATQRLALPKVMTTLQAFKVFNSNVSKSFGDTLVIWGGGDSAKTLVEYISGIFDSKSSSLRSVRKIIVITNEDLDCVRPRYSPITGIRSMEGKTNLLEIISSKVADVGFDPQDKDKKPADRQLVFYDPKGKLIKGADGKVVKGNCGIAAAGFKSEADTLFTNYLKDLGDDSTQIRRRLTLPSNPEVSVAQTLKSDPSVLFLGTASSPNLNQAKINQLPLASRKALKDVGANAVALGLRGQDTRAAVNIFLNSQVL